MNSDLRGNLSLTVRGFECLLIYDFQLITVSADTVGEFSFNWIVPDAAGTYVVEVGLVPAQLTAYDAGMLNVS